MRWRAVDQIPALLPADNQEESRSHARTEVFKSAFGFLGFALVFSTFIGVPFFLAVTNMLPSGAEVSVLAQSGRRTHSLMHHCRRCYHLLSFSPSPVTQHCPPLTPVGPIWPHNSTPSPWLILHGAHDVGNWCGVSGESGCGVRAGRRITDRHSPTHQSGNVDALGWDFVKPVVPGCFALMCFFTGIQLGIPALTGYSTWELEVVFIVFFGLCFYIYLFRGISRVSGAAFVEAAPPG